MLEVGRIQAAPDKKGNGSREKQNRQRKDQGFLQTLERAAAYRAAHPRQDSYTGPHKVDAEAARQNELQTLPQYIQRVNAEIGGFMVRSKWNPRPLLGRVKF